MTKLHSYIVKKAVDGYHHRGIQISAPNDEYHQGLVKLGALEEVAKETKSPPAPVPAKSDEPSAKKEGSE